MQKGNNRSRKPSPKEGQKNGMEVCDMRERRQLLAALCLEWYEDNGPGKRLPPKVLEVFKAQAGLL